MDDAQHQTLERFLTEIFPGSTPARRIRTALIKISMDSETHAIEVRDGSERRELILRLYRGRGAAGKAAREARALEELGRVGYPVPKLHGLELDPAPLGHPFTILQRVPGQPLGPLLGAAAPQERSRMRARFCRLLVDLHRLDPEPFADLIAPPDPEQPCGVLAPWFAEYRTRLARFPQIGTDDLFAWFESCVSAAELGKPVIVHRDFQPDNVLWADDGTAWVLDWTRMTLSDPRLDLGWTLVHARVNASPAERYALLAGYVAQAGASIDDAERFEEIALAQQVIEMAAELLEWIETEGPPTGLGDRVQVQQENIVGVHFHLLERTGLRAPQLEQLLTTLGSYRSHQG